MTARTAPPRAARADVKTVIRAILASAAGPLTIAQVAEQIPRSVDYTARLLDELHCEGAARRHTDPANHRRTLWTREARP